MTSLPGTFESTAAQIVAAVGVLLFLAMLGGSRLMRAYAEILKAKRPPGPPALAPATPPPIESGGDDPAVLEIEVIERRELTRRVIEPQNDPEPLTPAPPS